MDNNTSTIISRAPANTMLIGEHAVLYGALAIAAAISQFITVTITPHSSKKIYIKSTLGSLETTLEQQLDFKQHSNLKFAAACLASLKHKMPSGCSIEIESDFSATVGLGSSAAVCAALLAGLFKFCAIGYTQHSLFKHGLKIIQQVQGGGSGTDIAASIYGGIIVYDAKKQYIKRIDQGIDVNYPHMGLVYSGYKTTTPQVLKLVSTLAKQRPAIYHSIYASMRAVCEYAKTCVLNHDWQQFGAAMNHYQGLLDALGVNDATLAKIVYLLRQNPAVIGSKISGSGLGDSVLCIGSDELELNLDYDSFTFYPANEGVSTNVN